MRVVLDWGIGGLPTWARLADAGLSGVYVSDSGAMPYGKLGAGSRGPARLARRILGVLRAVEGQEGRALSELVVACNAASIVAPELREALGIEVIDVLRAGVRLMLRSPKRRVGVIGGGATIASRRIEDPLRKAGFDVLARSAQPLSAHVEAGRLSGDALMADLEAILSSFRDREALLLACTHYPALVPAMEPLLPGVALVDPSSALATEVALRGSDRGGQGIWTTGDPEALALGAHRAFGLEVSAVRRLRM